MEGFIITFSSYSHQGSISCHSMGGVGMFVMFPIHYVYKYKGSKYSYL